MKVACIPPMTMLEFIADHRYHMMLPSHALENPLYEDFYFNQDGFKILDNGEAEGLKVSTSELFALARGMGADEIVVPDVLGNHKETIALANKFKPNAEDNPEFGYMGVIQGENHTEYMDCFYELVSLDYITTIGLPRIMNKDNIWCRAAFVETIEKYGLTEKPIHCLGASKWMKEVALLCEFNSIRGIDTSLPFVLGLESIDIKKGPYIVRQPNYFFSEADYFKSGVILANIDAYRDWAGDIQEEALESAL